jgi:hypothetical protein
MSSEQLDKLKEALANTKPAEFRWADSPEVAPTPALTPAPTPLPAYSGLFGNTISITGGTGTTYQYSNSSNPVWTTSGTSGFGTTPASMQIDGDLVVNGKNIGKILDKIQDRLSILDEPSLEKLEKHAALKKAYEQYKILEKLIGED